MNINLIVYPLIIILGLLFSNEGTNRAKKGYICIIFFVFLLESSLRGLSVGSDTMNYVYMFKSISDYSWEEIWQLGLNRYLKNDGDFDIGYMVFQKLFSYVTSDFHVFTFFAQLIFFVPMGKMLYRYSPSIKSLIFAFCFFVALYQAHTFSGMRQLYSMGFSFLAVMYYEDKRYVAAAMAMVAGFLIHMTMLLMFIPLGVSFLSIKKQRLLHLISLLLIPVVLAVASSLIQYMGNFVGNDRYASYGDYGVKGGATTFLFCIELLSLFCYMFLKHDVVQKERTAKVLYCMFPCMTFFAPLIQVGGSMVRISEYYFLYLMVLFPLAIIHYAKSYQKGNMLLLILSIVLVLFSLATATGAGANYVFFWQEPGYISYCNHISN